jgi:hypothetical protein
MGPSGNRCVYSSLCLVPFHSPHPASSPSFSRPTNFHSVLTVSRSSSTRTDCQVRGERRARASTEGTQACLEVDCCCRGE